MNVKIYRFKLRDGIGDDGVGDGWWNVQKKNGGQFTNGKTQSLWWKN